MNKYIKMLLITFVALFGVNIKANAVVVNFSNSGWSGGTIYKYADGVNSNVALCEFWLEDGRAAFCLEYGADAITGTDLPKTDILEYFKKGLTETQAKALVTQINKYIYFGYGSEGMTSEKHYIATQKLIWEAISKSGFYSSTYYTNNVAKYSFKTLTFKHSNGTAVDVSNEVKAIEDAIKAHETKPSICSTTKSVALYDKISLEDTNKVLSQYKLTCPEGLKCKIADNKLEIESEKSGEGKKITFTKDAVGTATEMHKNSSYQGVVIAEGKVDAISCDLTINVEESNPETGGANILLILMIGLFCGMVAYITYNSSHKKEI